MVKQVVLILFLLTSSVNADCRYEASGEVLESVPLEPEALSEYKKSPEFLQTFLRSLIKLFQRKPILFKKFFQECAAL